MNPESVLEQVSRKMLTAAVGSIGPVRVCWLNGEFICLNASDRRAPELVIARFRAENIVSGLSAAEWSKLSQQLTEFLKIKR